MARKTTRPRKAGTSLFYEPEYVARDLKKSVLTLRNWRSRGLGPPWTRVGKSPFYPKEAYEEWKANLELHGV